METSRKLITSRKLRSHKDRRKIKDSLSYASAKHNIFLNHLNCTWHSLVLTLEPPVACNFVNNFIGIADEASVYNTDVFLTMIL